VEVGVPELKRPAPPKAKRGKSWEEEEEEQETPKTAKTTKGKRRTVVVDDEDLDLDEALDHANGDEAASTLASITLARPPKPKNRPGQTRPAAIAAPAQRAKKPSAPSERGNRRDRREQESKEKPEIITLTHGLTVAELADVMAVPETEIIKTLFMKGIMTTVNQILDVPTATMVAEEMGVLVETGTAQAEAKKVTEMLDASDMEKLQRRPPVVTIMGHVDHGKTTLLDSIRKTKVAAGEAGGITQHIGAYHVDVDHNGQTEQVVFLDTPGHEAFTAMRARGARVTDVAVLVVAADDGVRPQTIEAISHAKAAEVPIVVAINKVDKEDAQPDRVKQELTEFGLVAEEWGGDTIMVPVSALTGENLDTLLEMLLLVSEVEDLYANPDRPARGTVIEANLDKARGPVATLLIQNGTLKVGDILVAGSAFGKVRAMIDDRSKRVDIASPSFAVEVLGLSDVPAAGDEFEVYLDEKEARSVASNRMDQQRLSRLQQAMASRRVSLNSLSAQAQEGDLKELNLILKADVQGSVEAILAALQQLPQKEVQVRVLLAAPGEITETDVDLAAASNAVIVGFNTTFASGARQAADDAGVDVRDYNIIYKLLEDIQGAMEGLLEPELVEEPLGQVEVRAVFAVGRGAVAGCYVQSGKAIRNCRIRVRRGSEAVFEGNLDSLKRMKDDVKEVNAGYECGIGIDNFKDWQEGDIIETFRLATKRRTLSA
jgi:translation initiation factor IF-2